MAVDLGEGGTAKGNGQHKITYIGKLFLIKLLEQFVSLPHAFFSLVGQQGCQKLGSAGRGVAISGS